MEQLIEEALLIRERAYVPYSRFKVGAAVLAQSGKIYAGCNIENASYGLTNCAERTAIFNAVAQGETKLKALAVVADAPNPVSPCGACLQVMAEFGIEWVWLCNTAGQVEKVEFKNLLPYAFTKDCFSGDNVK